MKKRKTIKADAENKKSLFLLIGLTVSLAMTLFFLELKSYEGGPADLGRVDFQDDDEIAIITNRTPPPPPPPPPPGNPPCHEIDDLEDGFCVKHIAETEVPSSITVSIIYKQDPTLGRSKSNHDFKDINCAPDGCDVEEIPSSGRLQFKLTNLVSNFSCKLTNFNTDLELEVVTRASRDQS